MKKSGISQQQIARDLGVSQTLVSIVLNGRKKGVSEKAYERILAHAQRNGYRPKGIASELIAGPVKVGFILRAGATLYSQSPFFGHVAHGLHEYLSERGADLVFMGIEDDLDLDSLERLRTPGSYAGLVVLGEVKRPFLQALVKLHPRVVSVSCQYSGLCDSILPNEEHAADLLVQHLMDLGHTRFAWVGGNKGYQRSLSRFKALKSSLHLRNIEIDPRFCIESESGGDRRGGGTIAKTMLDCANEGERPTSWICFNGTMARGVVDLLKTQGVSVPGDISVAALDATRVCEEEHPTLTGASTSPELMGRMAAERLLEKEESKNGKSFFDMVLAAELNVRESTGSAAGKISKTTKVRKRVVALEDVR